MATFQEFHGISLAANSWIENLFVEQLAADPVPVGPGRVWFNTTDKVFRQSSLDGVGAVVVRTFATAEELAGVVGSLAALTTTEKGSVVGAINEVVASIEAEVTARAAADSQLAADLAAEVTARTAADTALSNQLAALGNAFNYVGALTGGADAGSAFDLDTLPDGQKDPGDYYKVTAAGYFTNSTLESPIFANIGDGLVFNITGTVDKIDNTDSNVQGTVGEIAVTGSTDTGFVVGLDGTFSGRVTTLESGLAAEVTARTAADTAITNSIGTLVSLTTTEKGTLVGAINELDSDLATEVSRATSVEGSLASLNTTVKTSLVNAVNEVVASVVTEASLRTAADTTLSNSIGTLANLTTTEKTNLVGAINEIKTLAGGGVDALKTAINNARYTETTAVAATSHTINHALGSTLVDVCVWIDRGDSVWRNDMAGVSILDANNIKVDLTAARNIRVTVEKMEDFA